jgi:hypothetical protein
MTDDLLKRADPYLTQCGSCDYGVHVPCTCPQPDRRPVMLDLVREVERLRAQLEEIRHLHTDSPAGVCPSCADLNAEIGDDPLVPYPCPTLRAMGVEEVRFG